jgi:enamine deaminase RidA (YjgF/YER057c/UK114 family)
MKRPSQISVRFSFDAVSSLAARTAAGSAARFASKRTPEHVMTIDIAGRLAQLGMTLPFAPSPRGAYVSAVIHDGIAYISGQVSRDGDEIITGPVDHDTPPDVIRHAARTCVLRALSVLVATLPAATAVERILFLRGFVNAVPGFVNHSQVMDEASTCSTTSSAKAAGTRDRHSALQACRATACSKSNSLSR